jgi:hypothetical protein
MSRPDRARGRRCRALLLAMALGVFLPIFDPSWITLGGAVAGIAVLAFVYARECRDGDARESANDATHT